MDNLRFRKGQSRGEKNKMAQATKIKPGIDNKNVGEGGSSNVKAAVQVLAQKPLDFAQRIKTIVKAIFRAVKSTVGLLIILGVYSMIGAYLFRYLEGEEEIVEVVTYNSTRDELLSNLTRLLSEGEVELAKEQLIEYESQLKAYFDHGLTVEKIKQGPTWTLMGSLVYCITIYTTIGYGHIAPNTDAGRVATIIYALIGIPLCLIILADLGKLITRAIKFIWVFIRRFYYTGNCILRKVTGLKAKKPNNKKSKEMNPAHADEDDDEDDSDTFEINDEFNLPVPVALLVIIIYLFGGAFMYLGWEDWGYLEAFYFVFVSVSTIGFGDVLPADQNMFLLSMIYIFIGLSLISMTINVFMDFFDALITKVKKRADKFAKQSMNKFTGSDDDSCTKNTNIIEKNHERHLLEDCNMSEHNDAGRSRSVSVETEIPGNDDDRCVIGEDSLRERYKTSTVSA